MCDQEVVYELSQSWHLINQSKFIKWDICPLLLFFWEINKNWGSVLIKLHNQVFKLLFVYVEVLHDHIVAETVSLVKVLPVIEEMTTILLWIPVHMDAVTIKRRFNKAGEGGVMLEFTGREEWWTPWRDRLKCWCDDQRTHHRKQYTTKHDFSRSSFPFLL